jgi:hypothetical protein
MLVIENKDKIVGLKFQMDNEWWQVDKVNEWDYNEMDEMYYVFDIVPTFKDRNQPEICIWLNRKGGPNGYKVTNNLTDDERYIQWGKYLEFDKFKKWIEVTAIIVWDNFNRGQTNNVPF